MNQTHNPEENRFTTPRFIMAFPNVFQPIERRGKLFYTATPVFNPAEFSEKEKQLWAAMKAGAQKAVRERFKCDLKDLAQNRRAFLRNEHRPKAKQYPPFDIPGGIYLNLSSKFKPDIIDINRTRITESDTESFYSGCICRATVHIYTGTEQGNFVKFGLNNIQVLVNDPARAPRRDGKRSADDDFDDEYDGGDTNDDFADAF